MRYIGYLSFAGNYALHDVHVPGYHAVNIAVHIMNSLLIYLFVNLLFKTEILATSHIREYGKTIALFSSLIFAVHPIQTQAVTYIVQRFTSLAAFFYLLSISCYMKMRVTQEGYERKRGRGYIITLYCLSLLFAALAMKTKEIAFTLPVMIAICEVLFFKGNIRRRIFYLIPLFITMVIIPISLIGINEPIGAVIGDVSDITRVQTNIPRLDYLFTQFTVIVTYIRLIFFPVNQNLDYEYPLYHSLFAPQVLISFLFIGSIMMLGLYLWYRYRNTALHTRLIIFGIFWFFIALSVESSIIPIKDVIFEHRVYLPSVGMFLSVITGIFSGIRAINNRVFAERAAIVALTLVVIIFGLMTYARNTVWQDERSLWEDVVNKSPYKPRAHYNLGRAYESKSLLDKAITEYERTISIDPGNFKTYNNLGNIFWAKGLYDQAIIYYTKALEVNQNNAIIYYNRGLLYALTNNHKRAIEDYSRAIQIDPKFINAYKNRGQSYIRLNKFDFALRDLTIAVIYNPNNSDALFLRGIAYTMLGDSVNSFRDFVQSCALKNKRSCEILDNWTKKNYSK
jgi:protein O-mannosyl-transferase